VAIGNATFVRDRNSLTKNEQSMQSFAIQTGRMETRIVGGVSSRLRKNSNSV
jgi:hypothetical protein